MTDGDRREVLVQSVERDEAELERALADLKRAVRRPFALADQVGERIGENPVPWIVSSLLVGLWLGSRE